MDSGLYIAATPIGNLGDATLRLIQVLKESDFIFAENTKVTIKLLNHFQITPKNLQSYHEHSSPAIRNKILTLAKNSTVTLVSDAGTPLISDPGFELVAECLSQNIKVITVPGPSSLTSALSICGLPVSQFIFFGFFNDNTKTIKKINTFLQSDFNGSLAWFVPGRDIVSFIKFIKDKINNNYHTKISICREMTKIFEEVICNTAEEVLTHYQSTPESCKGEAVAIVSFSKYNSKQQTPEETEQNLETAITKIIQERNFLKDLSVNTLSSIISTYHAHELNAHKKEIYKALLKIQQPKE